MRPGSLVLASSLVLALACGGDDGGPSSTTTEGGSSTSAGSTGAGSGSTSGGDSTSGSAGSTSAGSTAGESTGGSTGGSAGSTGADTGASTGEASTGGTTGGMVFATFSCTETSVVEAYLVETIEGSFDEAGTPLDLVATFTQSGNVDFQIDVALPVAPDDPHYDEVVYWEDSLTMQGWNVTPPGDPLADRRYFFAPEGAQYVALFSAFYYRVYEAGGNGQFEFECIRL